MKRLLLLTIVCAQFASTASAQIVGGVFSQEEAQRHGLKRVWFAQADVDSTTGKIAEITLDSGTLFVQTNRGTLQAVDAETGRTLWSTKLGSDRFPAIAPAANAQYVAATNGMTLFVLDRTTGHEVWTRQLKHVAGAGPALSDTHVFVPMVNGMIFGIRIKKEKDKPLPWMYKSHGRILVQPVITSATLAWTTEEGYLYLMSLADPDHLQVNRRLETNEKIESRPGYWTPYLYGVSLEGYAYAVNEKTGRIDWKYSTAEQLVEAPVAVAGKVYVCAEKGGMYCLDGVTGEANWFTPSITQFISLTPTHVYTVDRMGRMVVLDAKSGGRVDTFPIPGIERKLRNVQSDRIYLANHRGTIQCLREAELTKPIVYSPPPLKVEEKPTTKQKKLEVEPAAEEPAAEASAEGDAGAFGDDAAPAAEEAGEEMKEEGAEPAAEADPFS